MATLKVMLNEAVITKREENIISLRTAYFWDDGVMGTLVLLPPVSDRWAEGQIHGDVCWVYKRRRPLLSRLKGCYRRHESASVLREMKAGTVSEYPEIEFKWADTGHSVAVLVDGVALGFIAESRANSCSKAFVKQGNSNHWDEELFQRTFGVWTRTDH